MILYLKNLRRKKYMLKKKEINIPIFFVIFAVKFFIYYYLMEIPTNIILHAMVSSILMFFVLLVFIKKRKGRIAFFLIYLLSSFLMIIDVVYLKYFNDTFKLAYFRYISEFIEVLDILFVIVELKHLLVFIDVVLVGFLIFRIKGDYDVFNLKAVPLLAVVSIVGFTLFNPFGNTDIESVSNREFFNYYLKDAYGLASGDKVEIKKVDEFTFLKDKDNDNGKKFEGIAEGRNLIVIQVESLQDLVVNKKYNGQEISPNLNKLISEDSLYFNNYYQQLGKGNTSDAEFVSNNSIYAPIHGQAFKIYQDDYFYGLPWILKDQGYSTAALHGYRGDFWNRDKAYPAQGFDEFYSEKDYNFEEKLVMGIGDREFFDQSINFMKEFDQPFYSMMITLTSHVPYDIPEDKKNLSLEPRDEGTLFGDYLQAVNYTDRAIGEFIENLKEEGLYDNSIIAIYGDHFGITTNDSKMNDRLSEFVGKNYDYDQMLNVPLIINIPGEEINDTVEIAGGQVDFMPTILNLMGVENKNPVVFGQDLLNADEGFVISQTYMLKGSYIDDDIVFEMSRDGVFKNSRAWDKESGEQVDLEDCRQGYEKAVKLIEESVYILENKVIEKVVRDGLSINNLAVANKGIQPPKYIAHAGGKIQGETYTNCKEALDLSLKEGAKLIEVDFEWTTDGEPVLVHSWDGFVEKFFGAARERHNYEEFKNFTMFNGWTQLTLEGLAEWMENNKDAYIVTDSKGHNEKLLRLIDERHPEIKDRIIPQIYYMEEYVRAEYYGYRNIIYTLYITKNTEDEIIDFIKHNELFALTMPVDMINKDFIDRIKETDTFIYTHTINDLEKVKEYEEIGIDGFYTDDLFKNEES
jgi:phosphoglycerol transferase MdoB-like AlkP superfamily enzyme/glycerophosphoryl diester phosphodiesterase